MSIVRRDNARSVHAPTGAHVVRSRQRERVYSSDMAVRTSPHWLDRLRTKRAEVKRLLCVPPATIALATSARGLILADVGKWCDYSSLPDAPAGVVANTAAVTGSCQVYDSRRLQGLLDDVQTLVELDLRDGQRRGDPHGPRLGRVQDRPQLSAAVDDLLWLLKPCPAL